ncbi:hypothetical protein HUU40_00090 [candidate division KSB1 bacterium]|nr:hypothetical protein [candidate division KSB1 bacterium]
MNTNAGCKLYVCSTPQEIGIDETDFEALNWVEVKGLGSHGETGSATNILNYDTWDLKVIQKAKGLTNAGDPLIELARRPTDPGQIIMRAAAKTNGNYAFKMQRNDAITPTTGTPTILYNLGLVTGPVRPHGRNEAFEIENFTVALNQEEIVVDPT